MKNGSPKATAYFNPENIPPTKMQGNPDDKA